MGVIYEVEQMTTRTRRALKLMKPELLLDESLRQRFVKEARVVSQVKSDHVVQVLDAGIDESTGAPFLVMELLRGDDLGQRLKRRGPLPAEEVVLYLHQAALGLDKTHAAGVVHRDLKPENLFVTRRDDGTACVKILDFGVAKLVHGHGGGGGTRSVGTPLYMAPEQILGNSSIGPRTDIYALGHVAYTLLVGKAYWREEATSKDALLPLLSRVSAGAVEPPSVRSARWNGPSLSITFDEWFFRATARDPENRFESASLAIGALSEALRRRGQEVTQPLPTAAVVSGLSASSNLAAPVQPVLEAQEMPSMSAIPMTRRRNASLIVGAIVLLGLVFVAFVATQSSSKASVTPNEITSAPSVAAIAAPSTAAPALTNPPAPVSVAPPMPTVEPAPVVVPLPKKRSESAPAARVVPVKPIQEKPAPPVGGPTTSEPL